MICICGHSALMFWRSIENATAFRTQRVRIGIEAFVRPDPRELNRVDWASLGLDPASLPIELMVCSPRERARDKGFSYRSRTTPLPKDAIVRIANGLYVASPELTLLQMGSALSVPALARVAYELCGSYALTSGSWEVECREIPRVRRRTARGYVGPHTDVIGAPAQRAFRPRTVPLSSVSRIHAFLAQNALRGERGVAACRDAIRYVADGARSPMETVTVLLLCLPTRLGGYGLPLPSLNHRIDMGRYLRTVPSKRQYFCDLYWPEHNLCVEYDSDAFHARSAGQLEQTRIRALNLGLANVSVISLGPEQLYKTGLFDAVARSVGKHLGRRIRIRSRKFADARRVLRAELLPRRNY